MFSPLLIRHNSFVMVGDCYSGYYSVLAYISFYIRQFIPNLLHGKIIMYETAIGFGDDIIGTLNWSGLGDIFLFPVALFPKEYTSYAFSLVVVLKLFFSGLTFLFYGRSKKLENRSLFIGTFMYVFCYYAVGMGLTALNFSTPMVYLPLIIYGIDSIINDSKESSLYIKPLFIISVFLESLCGFYFLYMIILASIVYFVIQCIFAAFSRSFGLRMCFLKLLYIVLHYVIGMGLAAVLLIPVILAYLQCLRRGDSSVSISRLFELPSSSYLVSSLQNIITPPYSCGENGLFIPVFAIICVEYVLTRIKNGCCKKGVFCLMALYAYLFPTIGLISNGFAYSTRRWLFILFFFMSYMVASVYQEVLHNFSKIDGLICSFLFVIWVALEIVLKEKNESFIIRIILYSAVWIMTIVLLLLKNSSDKVYKRIRINNLLFLLVVINIVFNGFYFFAPKKIGGSGIGGSFSTLNSIYPEIMNSKLAHISDIEKKENALCRYDYNDTAFTAPMLLNVNSTYSYYNIYNGSLFSILNETRVSPSIMDTFIIQGLDSRQVLETIMSVKKYALNTDDYKLKDNDYYLPVGFTYDSAVSEKAISCLDYLQKTNTMMSDIIIDDDDIAYYQQEQTSNNTETNNNTIDTFVSGDKLQSEVELNTERNIPITISYGDGIAANGNKLIIDKGAAICISFEKLISDEPGKEYYILLNNFTKEFSEDSNYKADVNLAGKYVRLRSTDNEWFYNKNFDYLVQVSDAASTGKIVIVFQEAGEYTMDGISLIGNNVDNFEKKYSELGEDVLQNSNLEDNHLSGSISLETGKWMFVSLPYSKGWSCTIDGEKTHISKANYSFMAVFVPAGEHNIVFSYVTPGIIGGAIVSLLSLIILIVLFIFSKSRIRKDDSV